CGTTAYLFQRSGRHSCHSACGRIYRCSLFFFFNATSTTAIYTLSLHDALPIASGAAGQLRGVVPPHRRGELPLEPEGPRRGRGRDRKSTRLNSSHVAISYAVFCLKKKTNVLVGILLFMLYLRLQNI